jgi:hypothetical protein
MIAAQLDILCPCVFHFITQTLEKENFYFYRGGFKATDCVREQGAGR